jgi:hypothetical protein
VDGPCFSYVMINMHEKYNDVLVGSPLLFVRSDTHIKSSTSRDARRSGASCFLYVMIRV